MLLGSLLNARMPPKKSVPKVGKGCETTEVTLPRVVPNMLSTRVKPSLPSLSNIFSATKMKPFSTPYARKSCDQSRHGVKVVKRNGGKVAKRSFISGSESESELDSVVGDKEASNEAEAVVARRQGGTEVNSKLQEADNKHRQEVADMEAKLRRMEAAKEQITGERATLLEMNTALSGQVSLMLNPNFEVSFLGD